MNGEASIVAIYLSDTSKVSDMAQIIHGLKMGSSRLGWTVHPKVMDLGLV